MSSTWKSLNSIIPDIIKRIIKNNIPDNNYINTYRLLIRCLPEKWQYCVLPGRISQYHWQLFVANDTEAFQLHFLLPEIQEKLAKSMKYPPTLKVNAHPGLWQNFPTYRRPIKVRYARTYSAQEAHEIIQDFLLRQHG